MRCSNARKVIPFLVNNELDESKRPTLEEHLRRCSTCRAIAGEYTKLSRLAQAIPGPQEPPGFYDEFLREILNRVPENRRVYQRTDQARTVRHAFRPRYAMAVIGLLLSAILFAVLFNLREDTTRHVQRPTLETYLKQSDFIGLACAMEDDQQRNKLMTDTVSVDLLVNCLQRLQRSHTRHGQAGRHLARYMAMALRQWDGLVGLSDVELQQTMAAGFLQVGMKAVEFDFKKALRALRNINRAGARVTLKDFLESWALRHKR